MGGKLGRFLIKNFIENLITYLIIFTVFIIGIFFGSLGVKELDNIQITELVKYIDGYINNLPTAAVNANLETIHALSVNLKTLLYIWFLGLVAIGIPLTMIIIFIRGYIFGFTSNFLLEEKSSHGLLIFLLGILPQNILFIPVFLFASVTSISFSLYIIKGRFAGRTLKLSKKFLVYTMIFLVLGLFDVLAALIQGYVSPSLVKAVLYLN